MPLLPGSEKIPAGEATDFKAFMLRVDPALHQRIFDAAADERVSMNLYLTRILEREVPCVARVHATSDA
jgi:predicted HicB family RNase H-like nuclease